MTCAVSMVSISIFFSNKTCMSQRWRIYVHSQSFHFLKQIFCLMSLFSSIMRCPRIFLAFKTWPALWVIVLFLPLCSITFLGNGEVLSFPISFSTIENCISLILVGTVIPRNSDATASLVSNKGNMCAGIGIYTPHTQIEKI